MTLHPDFDLERQAQFSDEIFYRFFRGDQDYKVIHMYHEDRLRLSSNYAPKRVASTPLRTLRVSVYSNGTVDVA